MIASPGGGALPEGAIAGGPAMNQAVTSVSFAFNYNDNSINQPFPSAFLVASLPFITPVGIISIVLSTSILNGGNSVLAVFVAKNVGNILSVTQNGNVYVEHVVNTTLGHSMRTGMAFSDDVSPRFGSGEKLSVYVSDNQSGGNLVAGVVTVRYFSAT